MNRVLITLGIVHALWIAGGILFYIEPSFFSIVLFLLGLGLRNAAPVTERKNEKANTASAIFGAIWTVALLNWLNTKGLREVTEKAFDERFSLVPVLLVLSILASLVIIDWIYVSSLTREQIEIYYSKKGKA